jgi:hypothetical protein
LASQNDRYAIFSISVMVTLLTKISCFCVFTQPRPIADVGDSERFDVAEATFPWQHAQLHPG